MSETLQDALVLAVRVWTFSVFLSVALSLWQLFYGIFLVFKRKDDEKLLKDLIDSMKNSPNEPKV